MSSVLFRLALCLTLVGCAFGDEPSEKEILATVRRFAPSATLVPPPPNALHAFAGEFTRHPELERRIGPLPNSDHLYLLPDGSYLFVRCGDILPDTIYDRGTWRLDGRFIRLVSDGSLPRKEAISGAMIPLRVHVDGASRLFLLSLQRGYRSLTAERTPDKLAFVSFARSGANKISPARGETLKKRLLRDAWPRPGWFRGS